MLIVGALGLGVRVFIALFPWSFLCGDAGVMGLMAKHIWRGESAPVFFYGQAYCGSLSAWMMAPLYGLFGADFRGVLANQVIWFAIGVPIYYRLLHELGGRWGAIVGLVALGLGTHPLLDTAAMANYFELLVLAALLYLAVARAARRGIGDAEAGFLGLLMSGGCWLNPQFVAPCAAAVVVLLAMSPLRGLVGTHELERRVGRRLAWEIRLGLVVAITMVVGAVALMVHGSGRWEIRGHDISVEHPVRYVYRWGAVLLALWWILELVFSPRRRALYAGLAGLVVGQLPLVGYRLAGGERLHRVPSSFAGNTLASNARDAFELAGDVLFGQSEIAPTARWLGGWAIALIAAVPATVALARLALDVTALLRLRPVRIGFPAMLAAHALVTTAGVLLYASAEPLQERYFVTLWLPFVGCLAMAAKALARVGRAAPATLLVLVIGHYARDFYGVARDCVAKDLRPRYRELEEGMAQRGATLGYADYDTAYLASYFSDERIRLTCYGGAFARDARSREAAALEPFPVVVFDEHQRADREHLEARLSALVVDRWSYGRYAYVRLQRPPGRWITLLQGEPAAD